MTLKEALKNIDFSKPEVPEDLFSFFDFWCFDPAFYGQNRLVEYPVAEWLCTDTHVGLYAIYFDGYFVAVRTQECRKCDVDITFCSKTRLHAVRSYIKTFTDTDSYDEYIDNNVIESDISSWIKKKDEMNLYRRRY